MTVKELKEELEYLQSNDNLSDDAKVEIMIGGLDDRRLVKFGAATSETRVRSAVVTPFSMQSVTLEAEFNGEETLADHVSIGDRNMNNVEMEKDDDDFDIEQRRLNPPSFMGLMDVLMFGKYSFIFWIVFFIVSVPTFIFVTNPSFFEHFTKNSQTDGIERPYKAPFEEDKTQEPSFFCFLVTSKDHVVINQSESDCAEFGIVLGDSPVSDYANGFIFSYLDLDGNVLDAPPVKVTGVKSDKKNGWCTAAVSARKEGACYVRCSHRLATYSITDVLVIVTAGKNI